MLQVRITVSHVSAADNNDDVMLIGGGLDGTQVTKKAPGAKQVRPVAWKVPAGEMDERPRDGDVSKVGIVCRQGHDEAWPVRRKIRRWPERRYEPYGFQFPTKGDKVFNAIERNNATTLLQKAAAKRMQRS